MTREDLKALQTFTFSGCILALYLIGQERNGFCSWGNAHSNDLGVVFRVISVSGFPEKTSMAVVVEAFEKQGKILV